MSLREYTLFDESIQTHLDAEEVQFAEGLRESFERRMDSITESGRQPVIYVSLCPAQLLYFHVYLATLIRHLTNENSKVLVVSSDRAIRAHDWRRYPETMARSRFMDLLSALGVGSDHINYDHSDIHVESLQKNSDYNRFLHSMNIYDLVEEMKATTLTRPFSSVLDWESYAMDSFLSVKHYPDQYGQVDFVAGTIERCIVYHYGLNVLARDVPDIVSLPSVLPFPSLPIIRVAEGYDVPYLHLGDAAEREAISTKLTKAGLSREETLKVLIFWLLPAERILGIRMEGLSKIRGRSHDRLDSIDIRNCVVDGIMELFSTIYEKMRDRQVLDEVSIDVTPLTLRALANEKRLRILQMVLEYPDGISMEEVQVKTRYDQSTVSRYTDELARAGFVVKRTVKHLRDDGSTTSKRMIQPVGRQLSLHIPRKREGLVED